jgi:hypothetical protein
VGVRQIDDPLLIAYLLAQCDMTRDEAEERILLMTIQGEDDAEQEA